MDHSTYKKYDEALDKVFHEQMGVFDEYENEYQHLPEWKVFIEEIKNQFLKEIKTEKARIKEEVQ